MNHVEKFGSLPDAAIAFFDLDETITDADTDSLWSGWRSRREVRGWVERAWLFKLYHDFRNARMDIEEYMKYQRFRIGALTIDEFRAAGTAFFNDSGRFHIYREAGVLVRDFKKAGCRVVLLTAQNDCIAGPFAGYLGIDDLIANRFEIDGPRYGDPVKPYCFGEGKVVLGRKFADDAGVPLSRCAFFADSVYDAPFLGMVGFPYAANPDSMLEALARQKNWRIVRFSGVSTR
jgi:HAD superfamily hydrolase (TIGR01490 family)